MKIKLDEGAKLPTRAHATDAGLDLYAMEDRIISARESAEFDTGVHIELPAGTVGFWRRDATDSAQISTEAAIITTVFRTRREFDFSALGGALELLDWSEEEP